jgi:glycosyltransferase involved in cell wall biosynthesis
MESSASLRVVFMSWRDTGHPDGGGSEVYVERMAAAAAARGHHVTLFCAAYPAAPRVEERDGYRIVRRGGRFSVYLWGALLCLTGRLGRADVVVDVQNGVPFGAALYARRARVLMLVHHVHREHWPVVFGPGWARLGWWIESRLAPRIGRRAGYLTVSEATREELAALGVDPAKVRIIHNAIEPLAATGTDRIGRAPVRSPNPAICVLGRLVPHKRVELALEATARLVPDFPGLTLTVVGQGWWQERLRAHAAALGIGSQVRFTGWVDEAEKHEILSHAWVLALPSVKEGWGIVVLEAGQHRVPAVAFTSAGGLAEAVLDGRTGLLVPDLEAFTEALRRLLSDPALRAELGERAAEHTASFDWQRSMTAFLEILDETRPRRQATACQTSEATPSTAPAAGSEHPGSPGSPGSPDSPDSSAAGTPATTRYQESA